MTHPLSLPHSSLPHPVLAPVCYGQDVGDGVFQQARKQGRLAHGWLLVGPNGVGKRTLAYRWIRQLLEDAQYIPGDGSFLLRLVAGSHSDFFTPPGGRMEDVRALHQFLQRSSLEGRVRVVLLNDVDTWTLNASNGLLKALEEPQDDTFFFLTAQKLGGVLPTLRSRCRVLSVSPLSLPLFQQALEELAPRFPVLKGVRPDDGVSLWELTGGCLGKALGLVSETAESLPLSDLKKLLTLLTHGLYPRHHPDFRCPFGPGDMSLWGQLPPPLLAEIFLTWLQGAIVHAQTVGGAGGEPSPLALLWEGRDPLTLHETWDAVKALLVNGLTFNCEGMALAVAAWGTLHAGHKG